ncbi:alpha/beta hydrolase [Verrucosispora sp. WMMA2121]|uniref:alpha/beta hydrolase n=1 Tax=Verrucosispora sp. WMMA2121 TaxID=3015164 RepID=UPI0022B6287E|nr:alpha/beta hydrolase [Verrucosispora sp. WMMA2121]MCZ7423555.1 alpha/beta hydrolase [Verrucosispora sp. WMMA2121]
MSDRTSEHRTHTYPGGGMNSERVTFTADGLTLVGNLAVAADGAPAVVLTGPFTGVKEQVVGTYAARLHEHGLTTLAFDHRGFGESGGRRAHEDSQGKLADLRAAVSLLAAHPAVDAARVAAVGICLGGGYAVRAAATDPRIRAVVGIAGGYNSPVRFSAGDPDGYRQALVSFVERYDDELPAVAADGAPAAMGGDEPFAYYGTERSAAAHWENRVTYGSLHALMTFDALGAAPLLAATPLLVVHGRTDAYCAPELAAALHAEATGPKEIRWLDAEQHIDLYDVEPYVSQAADAAATFLRHHLGGVT